jgi:ubiquitin C-terminal hydrolase
MDIRFASKDGPRQDDIEMVEASADYVGGPETSRYAQDGGQQWFGSFANLVEMMHYTVIRTVSEPAFLDILSGNRLTHRIQQENHRIQPFIIPTLQDDSIVSTKHRFSDNRSSI